MDGSQLIASVDDWPVARNERQQAIIDHYKMCAELGIPTSVDGVKVEKPKTLKQAIHVGAKREAKRIAATVDAELLRILKRTN